MVPIFDGLDYFNIKSMFIDYSINTKLINQNEVFEGRHKNGALVTHVLRLE